MPKARPSQIEMIPISRITVLNPRARNKRQHREIVNNIEAIGPAVRIGGTESGGPIVVPALKVRDFNFTSLSDAV